MIGSLAAGDPFGNFWLSCHDNVVPSSSHQISSSTPPLSGLGNHLPKTHRSNCKFGKCQKIKYGPLQIIEDSPRQEDLIAKKRTGRQFVWPIKRGSHYWSQHAGYLTQKHKGPRPNNLRKWIRGACWWKVLQNNQRKFRRETPSYGLSHS